MVKYIGDVATDKAQLEVYECSCGFHIGFDSSYLEQVGGIKCTCPSCDRPMQVEGETEDEDD